MAEDELEFEEAKFMLVLAHFAEKSQFFRHLPAELDLPALMLGYELFGDLDIPGLPDDEETSLHLRDLSDCIEKVGKEDQIGIGVAKEIGRRPVLDQLKDGVQNRCSELVPPDRGNMVCSQLPRVSGLCGGCFELTWGLAGLLGLWGGAGNRPILRDDQFSAEAREHVVVGG
jgi:hypothetical protein